MNTLTVIDGHQGFRATLSRHLETTGEFKIISEYEDAETFLNAEKKTNPDLFLLAILLPGMDGLSLLTEIRKLYPETPVVILSAANDEQYLKQAYALGAADYITKDNTHEQLIPAIKKILVGKGLPDNKG